MVLCAPLSTNIWQHGSHLQFETCCGSVMTTVVVSLLLSYSVSVKGVFSPVPPYCGYSKPSHSFVIMLIYLVCLINHFTQLDVYAEKQSASNLSFISMVLFQFDESIYLTAHFSVTRARPIRFS